MTLFTVGHSTRSTPELVEILRRGSGEAPIELLVDVRRFPGSRRHPHFSREALAPALTAAGIEYRHEEALGGRRSGRKESPNTAWRVAGFRAYADHMATAEFQDALERLLAEAARRPTAVMCAEALPWRCHRRLIADAAVARGHRVVHLMAPCKEQDHELHPAARLLEDGILIYPPPEAAQGELF